MGMHRRSQHLLINGVDGVDSLDPLARRRDQDGAASDRRPGESSS
jgi:hypothetical protein